MKSFYKSSLAMFLILFFALASASTAQRIVKIAPTEFGILNKTIEGDTLENGDRVDLNTIYVLERGENAYYLLDGSIENRFPLTIVAEDGPGEKPKLVPGVVGGGESSRAFVPRADLTLKGLYITNMDQAGGLNKNMLRIKAGDVRIVIEDCHLDYDSQSAFRLDKDGIRLYLRNSIISNIGQTVNPNNGRAIDDRGNNIDTLVVENCTFYNITSRVLRDGGGYIKYARFNHNTIVNVGQMMLSVGEVVDFGFTNNLVINGIFMGNPVHAAVKHTALELEPLSDTDLAGLTQNIDIRNNNIYLDETIINSYPDTVEVAADFDSVALAAMQAAGTTDTNIKEAITFTKGPAVPVDVMLGIYADDQSTGDPTAPPFDTGGVGGFGEAGFGVVPFDFSYPNTTMSYTAGTSDQPLGALTWFGMDIIPVSVQPLTRDGAVVSDFRLLGNYPNPFNPTTNIQFDLPAAAQITVAVYDLLGRKVWSLAPQKMQAGNGQTITVDASALTSGVYFYQVKAEMQGAVTIKTGRMLLLK